MSGPSHPPRWRGSLLQGQEVHFVLGPENSNRNDTPQDVREPGDLRPDKELIGLFTADKSSMNALWISYRPLKAEFNSLKNLVNLHQGSHETTVFAFVYFHVSCFKKSQLRV